MDTTTFRTIVFLGSNPSKASSSIVPFWHDTKSTKVLKSWISQLTLSSYDRVVYMNVVNQPTPNNRPLKVSEIKAALPSLSEHLANIGASHIVTVGKTAAKAMTLLRCKHHAMPHTSGLNRQLNDKNFVEEKIKRLGEYLASK